MVVCIYDNLALITSKITTIIKILTANTMQQSTHSHHQFQQKHHQLSKISQKIDTFIQHFKNKNIDHTQSKCTQTTTHHINTINARIQPKLQKLKYSVLGVKEQFRNIRDDFMLCEKYCKEFGRMMVEIVAVCGKNWEQKEDGYRKEIGGLGQSNLGLRSKVEDMQKQLEQKQKELEQKQKQLEYRQKQLEILKQKYEPKKTYTLQHNHQTKQIQPFKTLSTLPIRNNNTQTQPISHTTQHQLICTTESPAAPLLHLSRESLQPQPEQQDLDTYINRMQITIRENDDPLFKKITEQCSQEEEEESSCQYDRHREIMRKNVTARSDLILEEFGDRKASQPNTGGDARTSKSKNMHKNQNYQDQNISRNTFWNKLSKTLNPKAKARKSLSQSKQNLHTKIPHYQKLNNQLKNGSMTTKLQYADKKITTSKITDFRRLLFVEKGMQRLGFKVENIM